MSDPKSGKRKRSSNILWLLVLLAVVLAWWYLRPSGTTGASRAEIEADRVAALGTDPDDILVDLVDSASDADVARIERQLGIDLELVSDQSLDERFYRAHVDPARRDAIIAELAKRPEVELAEPDAVIQLAPNAPRAVLTERAWEGFPNDPLYERQWHMNQIRMPAAWKLADGEGVIVAVIDTGVAHSDRDGFKVVEDLRDATFVKPYNFVHNNANAHDDHGHGTHVAGTIAQVTNNGIGVAGVARHAKIMPLKVLSAQGSGSVGAIADSIRYAADEGAKVINMSLGGRFPSKALERAVKYAYDKGVVVVCAAGNESRNKVSYPAGYKGAIAVSATQSDEKVTFYSNYGKNLDIAAPGGNTRPNGDGGVLQNTIAINDPSTNGYYGYMGTSMASPHAAGVAALIVGEGITEPAAVEKILKSTARQPDGYTKEKYGAGLIDAEAAVLAARSNNGGITLLIGLLLAAALGASLKQRGLLGARLGGGYLAGVMMGASGLFFLPYLSGWFATLPGVEMLTRGLPSWDMAILGPLSHGHALFFSALIPLALAALLLGVPRLRAPLAGLSLGVAAHLLLNAGVRFHDVRWMPDALDPIWLVANALLCVALAQLVLRRRV